MKPMRSLRVFARAAGMSPVTSCPSSRYLPSVGVSRSPSSASSVDLPQPEGPEIERNSPFATSRWMPSSACVSRSSVKKTLVRSTRLIMAVSCIPLSVLSVDDESVLAGPLGGVGEGHDVAGLEALEHDDLVHRGLAELHGHALGDGVAGLRAEYRGRGIGLRADRAADVAHVRERLDRDRAVDREIGARLRGELFVEVDLDAHRTRGDGGVHAHDSAADQAVTQIDDGRETRRQVAGVELRDAELRVQRAGLRDACDVRARGELLAFLHRDALHHARDSARDRQRVGREALLFGCALELPQPRLARFELGIDGGVERGEALLLDLRALPELLRLDLRAGILQLRDRALLKGALLRHRLETRGLRGRARLGEGGSPVQALTFELEPRGRVLGAGGGDFERRGVGRALDFGVRQLGDDGVGLDGLAGPHQHAIDAGLDAGREPARLARLQDTRPTDLAFEGAFLHLVEVELLTRDGGCARLELRYAQGDTGEQAEAAGHQDELPVPERLADARSIHQITTA